MPARSVFLLFLLPACLFAAERELSSSAPRVPAADARSGMLAAASAERVLAVWMDRRSGVTYEPFGTLLDHTGEPLRERSFPLGGAPFGVRAAASDGRDFLLAGFVETNTIGFRIVREDGAVVPLPARVHSSGEVSLIFTGSHYVLLHVDRGHRLACTVLSAAGEVLREAAVITTDPLNGLTAVQWQIAGNGAGGMFIVWRRAGDGLPRTRALTVAQLLAPDFAPVANAQRPHGDLATTDIGLSWNGREYLYVWCVSDLVVRAPRTFLQRLDRDGQQLGGTITLPFGGPRAVWTGTSWLFLAYSRWDESALVNVEGLVSVYGPLRPLDPGAFPSSFHPAVAVNGGVWMGWSKDDTQLYGDVVRADGTRRRAEGVLLSTGSPSQSLPSLAACGDSTFAAVWTETLGASYRSTIRFARIAVDGRQLGPIVTMGEASLPKASVACAGGSAVVVWDDSVPPQRPVIVASAVGEDHVPLPRVIVGDAASASLIPASDPAICWNGARFVVAYSHRENVMLAALDGSGNVVTPPQALRFGGRPYDKYPAIASHGGETFVAWLEGYDVGFTNNRSHTLRAARLGPTLAPGSPVVELEHGSMPAPVVTHGRPIVAAGPQGFLVVFVSETPSGPMLPWQKELRFARFDRSGALLDRAEGVALDARWNTETYTPGVYLDYFASAAWNGSAYEIAFRDRIFVVTPAGAVTSRRGLESGSAGALAFDGTRPLMLFTRPDPRDGTPRLWFTTTTAPVARRRASP